MKRKILKFMVIKTIALALLVPTIVLSPETEQPEMVNEVSVETLEKNLVSAGVYEEIVNEPIVIEMYSTDTIKVRREPEFNEENVVGLIPANSEMIWVENVDDMWSKVRINDKEYFISKKYITTEVPNEIVSILNIEPTHSGTYFVNKSSGEEVSNPNYVSLGTFKLTAYCPCSSCCGKWANDASVKVGAIGVPLVQGTSIAVDPRVIPYRSSVYIDGHEYKAHDCGGAIKGNRIDVYFEDHSAALNFGVRHREVFIWKY